MGIKLIVTDLDGTFLQTYHSLNEENVQAVKRARANGVYVSPVTARNWSAAKWSVTHSGFDPLCVINNGAAILDSQSEEIRFENRIISHAAKAILQAALEADASIEVFGPFYSVEYAPTRIENEMLTAWRAEWERKPLSFQPDIRLAHQPQELFEKAKDIAQNITVHGKNLGELPGWFFRRVIEQGEFYLTSSHLACIDIMAYGSTKAEGVMRLAGMLGVKQEEVMAFGDNSNDIGMIHWAGIGVAMGDAPEEVKAAANIVAPPHDQGGFAKVLEQTGVI